jgi:MinD-like ATPase involved in chromosome partitioning or flagellar assembly
MWRNTPVGSGRSGPVRVAVVSRDPALRLEAARAFDGAPASWVVSLHTTAPLDADVVVAAPDVEVSGAIPFDPSLPNAALQAVAARATAGARAVVVTSPSGGTGVTSVALHLAAAAARRHSTCYVDLDVKWGALDRLGLPDDARTWEPAEDSSDTVVHAAIPVQGGFRALLLHDAAHSAAAIEAAASQFERLFIDAPLAALSPEVLGPSTAGVLIVSPTVPSACRAHRVLDALAPVRWAIVANRLGPGGESTRTVLERILERPITLELPCAPALRDAEDDAALLSSGFSRWVRGIARLLDALESA